jgi:8-oxo-dGTP pyrophosphatase MutT (NUDIX family)
MAKGAQVAALCWRKRRGKVAVLLITSRETKRWVIPKGWPMPGLQDYNAARREAFEEAGVSGRMSKIPLGRFGYDKKRGRKLTAIRVSVYALAVEKTMRDWPERAERSRQWFAPEAAAALVNEAGLRRLLLQFKR